jgi:DNA-binding response OmpR family regulator
VRSVLVADHEPEVAELARRYLERAGLRVQVTGTPAGTIEALARRPERPERPERPGQAADAPDLFVIDLTMPGLEVRAIRQVLTPELPVVFLQHRGESRPHGLNSPPAARRWLTRPFSPRALVTAAAELTRPAPGRGAAGGGGADHGRHEIRVNGQDVSLTRTEYVLVTALAGQPGRVLSRQRLLTALETERGKRPSPRAVDVYIAQLRAKLGDGAIRTVHGVGYVLDPETTG